MDRGEGLNVHERGNVDGSNGADLSQIVAKEIYNHEVFRSVLDAGAKPFRVEFIGGWIFRPFERSLDGFGLNEIALVQAQETLWGGATYGRGGDGSGDAVECRKGGGVVGTQYVVEAKGVFVGGVRDELVGEAEFVAFSVFDFVLALTNVFLVV